MIALPPRDWRNLSDDAPRRAWRVACGDGATADLELSQTRHMVPKARNPSPSRTRNSNTWQRPNPRRKPNNRSANKRKPNPPALSHLQSQAFQPDAGWAHISPRKAPVHLSSGKNHRLRRRRRGSSDRSKIDVLRASGGVGWPCAVPARRRRQPRPAQRGVALVADPLPEESRAARSPEFLACPCGG